MCGGSPSGVKPSISTVCVMCVLLTNEKDVSLLWGKHGRIGFGLQCQFFLLKGTVIFLGKKTTFFEGLTEVA